MDLTHRIIGAAMAVYRAFRLGLDEKIYENSRSIELNTQPLSFTQQQQFPVYYKIQSVGKLTADLIVECKVNVETKAASFISDAHIAQTLSYLNISGLQVGLIPNFKEASLTIKRAANIYLKNPCNPWSNSSLSLS